MNKNIITPTLRMGYAALALGLVFSPVAALAQGAEQVPFGSLKLSDSKDPIKIDADKLEMRDKEGMAIFTGNVSVAQGDALLKSGKMIVYYNNDAETGEGGASGAAGLSSAGIDRLEVSGKVYLKSGTQIATGDTGTFDGKTQVMVLQGSKVVLTDGDNVATGCKLTANMDTGKAFLESCKGQSKGRVSIIMAPKDQSQGGTTPEPN
ncbi:LptA/OstA family protein [Falsochrobactrum ovis]|uniref:Lipopolysaccharide export system protein LptA n=1 Tax=Falsochrobactrum ovis TaxID=1293442 RepID=A0A364JZ96_9HYPH|nr:LptA/OstA family protein [Falsochrobactrum ovis]RAK34052.1 lipopolysaccharide export system protein LptA [Falsochrobactrum ovis]